VPLSRLRHRPGSERALTLLALKLLVVPTLLGLISVAGRKWGPGVAGWLAGFPVITGPILVFLATERGSGFAAQAASASLAAVSASTSFNLVYARVCRRSSWPLSLAAGLVAWLAAALVLERFAVTVWISLALALGALLVAPRFYPRIALPTAFKPLPRSELLLRMAAGALLTLIVTTVAGRIGPSWSGLFAVFPLLGVVLSAFSHASNGPAFVIPLLRGMVVGHYSFSAFCLGVALLVPMYGSAIGFTASLLAALAVQWLARLAPRLLPKRAVP